MCGRYASTRSAADLSALFDALDLTDGLEPDYNLAPTDPAPIVRVSTRTAGRVLTVARWGLVPAWSTSPTGGGRMINARAETVATTNAFATSFARRRCLVPAEGWYEWTKLPRGKQPYFMSRLDGEPIVFGGLWSSWGTDSAQVITFSIVTLPAAGELARVHDRMPLVLEPSRWHDWLTCVDASELLGPPGPVYVAGIETRPVSGAVGDVRNDGPDLMRPLTDPPAESTVETLF